MKLAVISDIHGNHVALDAVLRHVAATEVDGMVFLGDYATDFSGGHMVMERMRDCAKKYRVWFVRGNRDEYMLEHRRGKTPKWKPGSAYGSLYYAYRDLTQEDMDFMERLDYRENVQYAGAPTFAACHASPRACKDSIIDDDSAIEECLKMTGAPLMLCGHAHRTRSFCRGGMGAEFVGSVGLPMGAGGCAQFAYVMWDDNKFTVENVTIPYDVDAAIDACRVSGLMEVGGAWTQSVIAMARTGVDYCSALIKRAGMLARARGVWDPIPEDIWQRAVRDVGAI